MHASLGNETEAPREARSRKPVTALTYPDPR